MASEPGEVLFTSAVDREAKVAVIVADCDVHGDDDLTASKGWVIETSATCDPAEYAASYDEKLHRSVWRDRDGSRSPRSAVTSFLGHEQDRGRFCGRCGDVEVTGTDLLRGHRSVAPTAQRPGPPTRHRDVRSPADGR